MNWFLLEDSYFFIYQMSEQSTDSLTPAERAAKEEQEKLEKKKEQEEQARLPYRFVYFLHIYSMVF